jgi:hypothetical protein
MSVSKIYFRRCLHSTFESCGYRSKPRHSDWLLFTESGIVCQILTNLSWKYLGSIRVKLTHGICWKYLKTKKMVYETWFCLSSSVQLHIIQIQYFRNMGASVAEWSNARAFESRSTLMTEKQYSEITNPNPTNPKIILWAFSLLQHLKQRNTRDSHMWSGVKHALPRTTSKAATR